MNRIALRIIVCFVPLFVLTCFFNEISAGTSSGSYDNSHRKRDCIIKLVTTEGVPLCGGLIGIAQLRNDFAFGGTIRRDAFDTLGEAYGERFMSYFDVAAPENEMQWDYVMKCPQKCDPDFSHADFLTDWLLEKKISIRGRNLFSNEKENDIPEWTRSLGTAAFKQAMQERIDSAMGHFKGKVAQWDLVDAICRGENGSLPESGMLQTKSGDPAIFTWIMDEARKRDSVADFILNDYDLITSNDSAAATQYINKVKPLSGKFDIVGVKAHFGADMNKSSYEPKINYLAQQLGKRVWLTDVDFSFNISQAPDKLEELMRTCFANPNVAGISMGGWCQRYIPDGNFTSYFVDSLNNETPCGQRWRDLRDTFKTTAGGNTDDSGTIKFNGFCGLYHVLISCDFDTFYLEPGDGPKTVEVVYQHGTVVNHALKSLKITHIVINGIAVPVKLPAHYNIPLFLTTYSLSGQRLSRLLMNPAGGRYRIPLYSSCSRIFRIETADRLPLYTGKIRALR